MKSFVFERIMRRFKGSIYSYAYYFSGNHENAEDLTQEVLLKIWRNLDGLKRWPGKTWVMKVARNHCIDWARAQSTRRFASHPLDEARQEGAPGLRAHQLMDAEIVRERIEAAIACLPETLREAIILREIQELKYEEISRVLGIPLNTIKANIHRGRRLLRKQLVEQQSFAVQKRGVP